MEQLTKNLLNGMNPQQAEAVKSTEGPLLIMAGAGSGKTRVLTHRIAYLVVEKEVYPSKILAITFTNKAAREMRNRIDGLLGAGISESMWVSTFHSMCVRILRRNIDRIGISKNFSILDSADQLSVVKNVLKQLNIDSKRFEPRAILSAISSAKNECITADQYKANSNPNNPYEKVIAQVYEGYEKRLLKNQSLDFDDLIMTTIRLFERVPEVLEFYQNKFQYIHVDEYQDTNHSQYKLVQMLASKFKNICVVGDSDQSIYRWRGADIGNILSFEKDYPNAKVILLEQNYRSTKTILQAANQVIENNESRYPKRLRTDNDEGEKIVVFKAGNEQQEAQYVVKTIQQLMEKENRSLDDFAILYRTNAQSRVMEEVLVKSNMSYQIVGGTKFYDRKEIKDLLAYLRLIANNDDDLSLARIINEPKRSIGATSFERIATYAIEQDRSIFDAMNEVVFMGLTPKATSAVEKFRDLIEGLTKMQEYLSVTELVEQVIDKTGYRTMLQNEKTIEAESRLENIEEFLSVTKAFEERSDDKSLIAFLTDLALVADIDALDKEDSSKGNIILMTMHSAKGLEFPIVFIIGMEENIFPHSRSLDDPAEMEEERRLAYVGITRAEQKLYLTCAGSRTLFGRSSFNPPSRFLREISADILEQISLSNQHAFADHLPFGARRNDRAQSTRRTIGNVQSKAQVSSLESTGGNEIGWKLGDKAVHKKWGTGTVVSVRGNNDDLELDIAFPELGVKRLLAKFAPITKG
ncbi:ATP-dependent DNA helicase PcrA [Ureibacillus massiliensis 4400831 = CIP 108448 = CCUG 49529]|uniref:ATP-dependent DNA helicase n=1 Tax=Ureibacillus massiliensis 4400831 = CIP 108448 = CCUG 49529 TaxID=1211035 RepID=A0A0A3J757_9BACL|nr:DNA helicase PcrA [Ureibacillus massiliensis]KGR91018.1 ATP-dependent DNA helicase PcrA [Ureibacillus massiliensis 4400831 = CIP 108448 = CCUG 49529]